MQPEVDVPHAYQWGQLDICAISVPNSMMLRRFQGIPSQALKVFRPTE